MKTKNKTHKQTWSLRKKVVVGVVGFVVVGAIIFQIAFNMVIYPQAKSASSDHMADLLISAVEGLSKPVPVDAVTGRLYIANAKLTWPADSTVYGQVIYSNDSNWADESGMQFSTTAILSAASSKLRSIQGKSADSMQAVFEQLPNLQACSRGVQVYNKQQNFDSSDYVYQGATKLKDGRELHFYTESTCKQDQTALVAYLKKAESY